MYVWTALLAFGAVAVSVSGGPLPVLAGLGLAVAIALVVSGCRSCARSTPRTGERSSRPAPRDEGAGVPGASGASVMSR
jgi:hypothetical protein